MKKKPRGRPQTKIDINLVRALRSQGLSWRCISQRLSVGAGTLRRTTADLGWPKAPLGRPKKILDHRKLHSIDVPQMASPLHVFENLLIFDARCLDRKTREELQRLAPQLLHIHRAWKAEYMECGCISCHKKKVGYGAGGFCNACWGRIYMRMRNRFRRVMAGRDLPAELATFKNALQLKYNEAQRLFNGDDE
jgi:hypothetical protein